MPCIDDRELPGLYDRNEGPPHPPLSPLGRGLRRERSRTDGVRGRRLYFGTVLPRGGDSTIR